MNKYSSRLKNIGFKLLLPAFLLLQLLAPVFTLAQKPDTSLTLYRAAATKINNLVHTKLDVRFDYKKRYLYGKGWITLKPHFYDTDSLRLDAKGMDVNQVAIFKNGKNIPLKYTYDSLQLNIKLDKPYTAAESYTVYIAYTAKPEELKAQGSAAINDAKGLYFINPDSTEKNKPVQIWTQGETESSSAWFPTIDKPNQKSTSEISMTVPAKYVTLSNGRLAEQKKNKDGTRTDIWKMELPHAPYLFMMAVGDFKIYKDKWRNKEVSYYLEPQYAPYAKAIFGDTPEILEFYSQKLGLEYPWNKYAQIVVRDYVSGAMENTTATLHGEYVQATDRELLDAHPGEETIAHELFHHWFGDYVTAESWSNLAMNESFADLSETLWTEHKHGKDAGDAHNYESMQAYLGSASDQSKDLVRFHYHDKEDVFDLVSYQKGGRILNMLRNYLGEDAFFKGLNLYLKTNAFRSGEAHQLRLALEDVSGQDLNWFFNQWYFGSGNPVLDIDYRWDENTKIQTVYIKQLQENHAFKLPTMVDIYYGGKKERHQVWLKNKIDTLTFKLPGKPDLVNVDGDKIMLAEKTDHKTLQEYVFQYFNTPLYVDRIEAINAAAEKPEDPNAGKILLAALNDKYFGLRIKAIELFGDPNTKALQAEALPIILNLAKTDAKTLAQAAALKMLSQQTNEQYLPLFEEALKSRSYSVQGAALKGIAYLKPNEGLKLAREFEKDNRGELTQAMADIYANLGNENDFNFVSEAFNKGSINHKFGMLQAYIHMMGKVNDTKRISTQLEKVKEMAIRYKSSGVGPYLITMLQDLRKDKSDQIAQADSHTKVELNKQIGIIDQQIAAIKEDFN